MKLIIINIVNIINDLVFCYVSVGSTTTNLPPPTPPTGPPLGVSKAGSNVGLNLPPPGPPAGPLPSKATPAASRKPTPPVPDNWATIAAEQLRLVEAARLAAAAAENEERARRAAAAPPMPKRAAPIPEGHTQVEHKYINERQPLDRGVEGHVYYHTFTGLYRVDQVTWEMVNRLTELCPM